MIEEFIAGMKSKKKFRSSFRPSFGGGDYTLELNAADACKSHVLFNEQSHLWVESRTRLGDGFHEPGLVKSLLVLEEIYGKQRLRNFFDIGLLYGYVSLIASAVLGCKNIYGFEMNPASAAVASSNFRLNAGSDTMMHVVNAGVSNTTATNVPCIFKDFHLIVRPSEEVESECVKKSFKKADLTIVSLDDFVRLSGVVPDIIKIDVEGSQMSILEGGDEVLKSGPILLIESDAPASVNSEGISMSDICSMLIEKYGYDIVAFNHRLWNCDYTVLNKENFDALVDVEKNQLLVCLPKSAL